ncbi:MAG: oligosaccharide flippase family protein [Desulfovibrionaceae bacterium]|nr:oligosaccharide flippase family protein [Desulfovibrionaceae bacterium]
MKLKDIPKRVTFILSAQWARDLSWTLFTILLARHSQEILGQIVLALTYGYLVKTIVDVGLNDYLVASFSRGEGHPRRLLGEVSWLKAAVLLPALIFVWYVSGEQQYTTELRIIVLCIAGGLGLDAICDSFFALCQARGRQDVEMRIRIPSAIIGIGFGCLCVALKAPPLVIALYKPIESILSLVMALFSLRKNPLLGLGGSAFLELVRAMRKGLLFTGMALCAMFYNKINVIFLKRFGGDAAVGSYGVAWETIEGVSTLVSGAILGKVIFPILARLWDEDRAAFRALSGRVARSLWAAALPLIFFFCVESDRFLTIIYGSSYEGADTCQKLLTPCIATAFLHNLAAYAMIGMGKHVLLFFFYLSGLIVNIVCCFCIIPVAPLEGAALTLTITKVWVALFTVSYFQAKAQPMTCLQWLLLVVTAALAAFFWWFSAPYLPRECAELLGLMPLLALFWYWRPPPPYDL